jgi:hypothetical protein
MRLNPVQRRVVGGEGSDWAGRCVPGLEADGHPREP